MRAGILIILFLLVSDAGNAQTVKFPGSPFIRNYSRKEYMASSQNFSIAQDNRGVMYFGNTDGVLEFDGKNWQLIKVSNNSLVRSLVKDSAGVVYVGALGEFGYLATDAEGKIGYVSLTGKLREDEKKFADVWKIFPTTNGIFFMTNRKIFHYSDDTVNVIPVSLASNFGCISDGNLFIIKEDSGIYILKPRISNGQWKYSYQLLPYTGKLSEKPGSCVALPYSHGKLLICNYDRGMYIYDYSLVDSINVLSGDAQIKTEYSSPVKKLNTEIDEYIKANIMSTGIMVDSEHYAFSTYRGGVVIMNKDGSLGRVINKNRNLQSNCVYNIFADNDKNLWTAMEKGISYIEISSPITRYNESNGLEGYILSTINHNGRIYIGTSSGIFYLPEYTISVSDDSHNLLQVQNAKSVCWDFYSFENILLASSASGVLQIQNTVAVPVIEIGNIYCFGHSEKLPGYIFLGLTNGLAYIKVNNPGSGQNHYGRDETITVSSHGRIESIYDPIKKIISDGVGDLWLTTLYNGIFRLTFSDNTISDYQTVHYDTSDGLPQLNYNYVHYINDRLVVATQKGVYNADVATDSDSHNAGIRFFADTLFTRILNGPVIVTQIINEKDNKLWLNSESGVGMIDETEKNSKIYNNTPFKKIPSCYRFYLDPVGNIWVCTDEGLFHYVPEMYKNYRNSYKTLIRKVTTGNDSIIFYGTYFNDSLFGKNRFAPAALIQPKGLIPELPYTLNTVQIEYAALFFENNAANKYRYFLEGFDDEWSDWTEDTRKEYTNLFEGTYIFRVKAKNIFETESDEAVYKFRILPPWYRTTFAYIGFITLFMILSYIIVDKLIRIKNKVTEKYIRSSLSATQKDKLYGKLLEYFKNEKPYLNSSLTVVEIARKFDTNEKYMSQVINERFGKNFYTLVNELRIEEAKKLLVDPEFKKLTIEGIASTIGFNSRSSFNTAFKKVIGMTPSQYQKAWKNKR
ncbi:MAG: helix-turn-helix domain-containing protein [Bacteroidetes bacterium]|nr:helix-turn-helix domain-containing protein [Bacteroidota bacterium]